MLENKLHVKITYENFQDTKDPYSSMPLLGPTEARVVWKKTGKLLHMQPEFLGLLPIFASDSVLENTSSGNFGAAATTYAIKLPIIKC